MSDGGLLCCFTTVRRPKRQFLIAKDISMTTLLTTFVQKVMVMVMVLFELVGFEEDCDFKVLCYFNIF